LQAASSHLLDQSGDTLWAGEIGGKGEGHLAPAKLLGERSQPVRSPSDEDDRHPPSSQSPGKLSADPAAGTGHESCAHHGIGLVR